MAVNSKLLRPFLDAAHDPTNAPASAPHAAALSDFHAALLGVMPHALIEALGMVIAWDTTLDAPVGSCAIQYSFTVARVYQDASGWLYDFVNDDHGVSPALAYDQHTFVLAVDSALR